MSYQYVFGKDQDRETLQTKGSNHSDLTGFHEVTRAYPDQTITDNFHVIRKIDSKEDTEGNCYDWYEIDNHYRTTEKKNVPTVLKPETPVPVPAGASSASYRMEGLTENHILLDWGGSGENLDVIIRDGVFTVINHGESISAVIQPIFAIPAIVKTTIN